MIGYLSRTRILDMDVVPTIQDLGTNYIFLRFTKFR